MKNILFTLFSIGLAGIAAIAATSAFLNTPVRSQRTTDVILKNSIGPPAAENKPGASPPASSETPAPAPSTPPATPPAGNTGAPAAEGAKPAAPAGAEEPESDEDPYEGIAPEELPPDLQYDADSSVSFPTNI